MTGEPERYTMLRDHAEHLGRNLRAALYHLDQMRAIMRDKDHHTSRWSGPDTTARYLTGVKNRLLALEGLATELQLYWEQRRSDSARLEGTLLPDPPPRNTDHAEEGPVTDQKPVFENGQWTCPPGYAYPRCQRCFHAYFDLKPEPASGAASPDGGLCQWCRAEEPG